MRQQKFNKIKKTVFIFFAVFLVVSLTAASASAWYSKTSDDKCKSSLKEKVVKEVAKEKPVKEVARERVIRGAVKEKVVKVVAKERLGNEFLYFVENNWFDIGRGSYCDNGWFSDNWDDCWDC